MVRGEKKDAGQWNGSSVKSGMPRAQQGTAAKIRLGDLKLTKKKGGECRFYPCLIEGDTY